MFETEEDFNRLADILDDMGVTKESLYGPRTIHHYNGHTIIVMEDNIDHDYSFVSREGVYKTEERFTSMGAQDLGTGYASVREALETAKRHIDSVLVN